MRIEPIANEIRGPRKTRIAERNEVVQRTYHRCGDCRSRFGLNFIVHVPLGHYAAQLKAARCPECGSSRILMSEGRTLQEDIETRIEGSVARRIENWRARGETGLSSEAIVAHMTGNQARDMSSPRDLDDVRRCVLLLGHIPEWVGRMQQMGRYAGWERLAPQWAEVMKAYLTDSPNLDGPAPTAGSLLKELIR